MNITDVRVRKVAKEGKMKAVVSITIDDEFVVHDIKVIEGEKGLSLCQAARQLTENIAISRTRSIPEHVTESRQLFWRNTRKSWTQSQKKQWLQNNW